MKYLFPLLLIFTITCNSSLAQEDETTPVGSIKVPEWVDFQNTQDKLVEQNAKILGDLTEVRTNLRQINIKLIEILGTTQQQAATAGRDVHCDLFKTKYDPRVEWTVIALAVVGVYMVVSKVFTRNNVQKTT